MTEDQEKNVDFAAAICSYVYQKAKTQEEAILFLTGVTSSSCEVISSMYVDGFDTNAIRGFVAALLLKGPDEVGEEVHFDLASGERVDAAHQDN